jgi:hypothetical protein
MSGMNNGLNPDDPTMVAAFRAALLHQSVVVLLIFAVLSVAWVSVRGQPDGARAHVLAIPLTALGFLNPWSPRPP